MLKRTFSFALLICLLLCGCSSSTSQSIEYDTINGNDVSHEINEINSSLSQLIDSNNDVFIEDADSENDTTVSLLKEVYFEECTQQYESFMNSFVFPDWLSDVNNSTFVNSIAGFKGYKNQGKLVINVNEAVESFDLFINDFLIDSASIEKGKDIQIDFSEISKNGTNTIQVTNIRPASLKEAIKVNVLFPEIIAGTPEDAGIDSEVFELIDEIVSTDVTYGFPAASMAVIKDGMLIYENCWGYVNSYNEDLTPAKEKTMVTKDTLFDLASNTKMYSANYAIMYLVSSGELKLTDRVCDIIGKRFYEYTIDITYSSYRNPGLETNKKWKASITIEDLLCHRAGFPASPKYEIKTVDQSRQRLDLNTVNVLYSGTDGSFETREKTLESICKTPLMYEPGSKILYSDVDFMLLCFIVEELTGERFDIFLNNTFYEPLGLDHITYNPLNNGYDINDCAATELNGNSREGVVSFEGIRTNTVQGEVHDEMAYFTMAGISGHAGLFSNATDLAILASTMLTGGMNDKCFFTQNVIDAFISPNSPESTNWGTGWWRNGDNERPWYFGSESNSFVIGHQGWTGTLSVIDPQNDLVIIFLTNKINSPLVNKYKSTSFFEGGAFTSGSLGFSTQLVYRGLNSDNSNLCLSLLSLCADMVSESIKLIPVNGGKTCDDAAVRNAYSKMSVFLNQLSKAEVDIDKKMYASNVLLLFDEVRDKKAIEEFVTIIDSFE